MKNFSNENIKVKRKKLTKKEIVQIVIFAIGVILIAAGLICNYIQVPIKGTIYLTNTTVEQREERWEQVYSDKKEYYKNAGISSYQSYYNKEINYLYKFATFTYKVTKKYENDRKFYIEVNLHSITESSVTIKNARAYVPGPDGERITFYASVGSTVNPKNDLKINIQINEKVYSEYDLEEFRIILPSCDFNGHTDLSASTYNNQDYLERIENIAIYNKVVEEIGHMPGSADEKETDPIYKNVDNNFKSAFLLLVMFGSLIAITSIIVFVCHLHKRLTGHNSSTKISSTILADYSEAPEPIRVIVIDHKDCDHNLENKNKRVICAYCGSSYKESLTSCPKCGSSKIKVEKKLEDDKPSKETEN